MNIKNPRKTWMLIDELRLCSHGTGPKWIRPIPGTDHYCLDRNHLEPVQCEHSLSSRKCRNAPFAANGHMVQNPPCWNASYALRDIQNKENSNLTGWNEVALFWMSQCATCSPAWRFLYHVTVSCKGFLAYL